MKCSQIAAAVVMGVCIPGVAYADSDGYYCTGRGYLAYQFGMAPMPVAPHRVVTLTSSGPSRHSRTGAVGTATNSGARHAVRRRLGGHRVAHGCLPHNARQKRPPPV